MNKNIGPFLAFNKPWFQKNQRLLLFLLNAPLLKYWFRWVLRIRQHDCPLTERIVELGPNRFTFGERFFLKDGKWNVERTTDFRTHPKYGKRLYYAFRPFWWLVHFWDWAVADRFVPQWSYGFSTLTVYPQAGDGGANTTTDGSINNWGVERTWANTRGGTGQALEINVASSWVCYTNTSTTSGQWYGNHRSEYTLDTSSLTSSANISAATFSSYGVAGSSDSFSPAQNIVLTKSTPAANNSVSLADFAIANWTTEYGTGRIAISSWSTVAYNDFSMNATGLAAISKTGITKVGLLVSADFDNSEPTWAANGVAGAKSYFADQTGTTNDPKLVVTYSTFTPHFLSTLGVGT